jgi:MFS family permease
MAQTLISIEVLAVFIAVGNGILNPCLSSLISQAAGKSNRGTVLGAQQGIGSLARIIAPPINNYLVGVNSAIPFTASGCLMSIALGLSVSLKQPVSEVSSDHHSAGRENGQQQVSNPNDALAEVTVSE